MIHCQISWPRSGDCGGAGFEPGTYILHTYSYKKTYLLKGNCNKKIGFSGLYQAAEADFDDYKVVFLGKFEYIFETALAHESGP
jgi:hypothetical protein